MIATLTNIFLVVVASSDFAVVLISLFTPILCIFVKEEIVNQIKVSSFDPNQQNAKSKLQPRNRS